MQGALASTHPLRCLVACIQDTLYPASHLFSALFQVSSGPNSYALFETTYLLLIGVTTPSGRCLILRIKTLRGSALMEGKAHVPVVCRVCRRPVPTVSNVKGRSNVPALELVNLTTNRIDAPARICEEAHEGAPRAVRTPPRHAI